MNLINNIFVKIKSGRYIYKLKFLILKLKNKFLNIQLNYYGSCYGGWFIVNDDICSKSVIYSFGIGEDISFDQKLIKEKDVIIHAFDPTPRSWVHVNKINEPRIKLYKYGLSNIDCIKNFYAPQNKDHVSYSTYRNEQSTESIVDVQFYCLNSIMKKLNHDHIDLLKLDIEGEEFNVLEDIVNSHILPKQILVEFHPGKSKCFRNKHKFLINFLQDLGYNLVYFSHGFRECTFLLKS